MCILHIICIQQSQCTSSQTTRMQHLQSLWYTIRLVYRLFIYSLLSYCWLWSPFMLFAKDLILLLLLFHIIAGLMDLAFHNGPVESFYMPHTPAPWIVAQPQPVHKTLTFQPFEMHTPRDLKISNLFWLRLHFARRSQT